MKVGILQYVAVDGSLTTAIAVVRESVLVLVDRIDGYPTPVGYKTAEKWVDIFLSALPKAGQTFTYHSIRGFSRMLRDHGVYDCEIVQNFLDDLPKAAE